ncbi:MAG TPA: VOC family protein [Acidimicrobiales bacterium]|nr:VOC family protein [Acidimicrobiales bacterium]
MIDYRRLFHTGLRVTELEAAMAELGPALGLTWAEPRQGEQRFWTPDRGQQTAGLRFTYSVQGPQHIELLEGAAGSLWAGEEGPGVHHIGVWVDDLPAEARSLIAAGWDMVAAQASPNEGFGLYAYLAPPSGLLVELVDAAIEPHFQAWWSSRFVLDPELIK